jgi:predicted small metal-binding protein
MTTIEELLHTIEELISLADKALDHAVGRHGESELTEKMRERLEQIIDEHRKND